MGGDKIAALKTISLKAHLAQYDPGESYSVHDPDKPGVNSSELIQYRDLAHGLTRNEWWDRPKNDDGTRRNYFEVVTPAAGWNVGNDASNGRTPKRAIMVGGVPALPVGADRSDRSPVLTPMAPGASVAPSRLEHQGPAADAAAMHPHQEQQPVPTFACAELVVNPDLGRRLAQALGSHRVCHLQGHGIVSVADSIEAATIGAVHLEQLAEVNYRAAQLGRDPHVIPQTEIDALKRTLAPLAGRWAYYVDLANR